MPRKVAADGTAELLESVEPGAKQDLAPAGVTEPAATSSAEPGFPRTRGSGRVRHDEKITVYISGEELLRLEQARLALRAEHGLSVDRGRIVREAVAASLDGFDAAGATSELVRRLGQST